MKPAWLLPSLLLLISAAPATRPVEQLVIQMRHVEYAPKPKAAADALSPSAADIPADAKETTSLQVLSEPGVPFETVATVNGTRYSLRGKLTKAKSTEGEEYCRVEVEYAESSGHGDITQITSNIMVKTGESVRAGGIMRDASVIGLILAVKLPDAAPAH